MLWLLVCNLQAQVGNVRFTPMSPINGQHLGKVGALARDRYGALWISDQSSSAIFRYDGSRLTSYFYDGINPNSLGGWYPECMFSEPDTDIIWIGYYGQGLDRLDVATGEFIHFRHDPADPTSLANDTVSALLMDREGQLWVGTYGGLDRLDPASGTFVHYPHVAGNPASLSHDRVRALYEDRQGILWVGTGLAWDSDDEGGLNRFDQSTGTFVRYLHDAKDPNTLIDNKVRAIFEDSRGNLWIGTRGDGLHRYDRALDRIERCSYQDKRPGIPRRLTVTQPEDHITFITEDAAGCLWLGTLYKGIVRYDPASDTGVVFLPDNQQTDGFQDISGWCALASPDGQVWISTQQSTLYRVDLTPNQVSYVNSPGMLVTSFASLGGDELLVCAHQGLFQWNARTETLSRYPFQPADHLPFSFTELHAVLVDGAGEVWIATNQGLFRFDPKTKTHVHYRHEASDPASLSWNDIYGMAEGKDGSIWIRSWGGGVMKLDKRTEGFTRFFSGEAGSDPSISPYFYSLVSSRDGAIWASDRNAHVLRIDPKDGTVKKYFSDSEVSSMLEDASGEMWAVTWGGLCRLDTSIGRFRFFRTEGHALAQVMQPAAIQSDFEGNLWFSSVRGIYRLDPARKRFHVLGSDNGVIAPRFAHGSTCLLPDGQILFGTISGFYHFQPAGFRFSNTGINLLFTGLWLNGKEAKPASSGLIQAPLNQLTTVELPYNQNVIGIDISVVDFGGPETREFQYRLEPYDPGWRSLEGSSRVDYIKVPPGSYRFIVKGVSYISGEEVERILDIRISPPWWLTWWAYALYVLAAGMIVWRAYKFQQARIIRREHERAQARELEQAREIEKAYSELKTAQNQLVHAEKMASLGELTAGIAHEIQNPLNFVNNFSEVNVELISELEEAVRSGKNDQALEIAGDVRANEEKIRHHGSRADSIVKGMLQHSRRSAGAKEATDINQLADEYLRLAYHGLRAKDKSFNARFETRLDDTLPPVSVDPQEIGRVLLNLVNNAFYAVSERQRNQAMDFEPTVIVRTRRADKGIEIVVQDNGNGITEAIRDKIFQPFFTTKAAGQGTGLGLSLSYDIIKAHGGNLKVETREGEGSEFIIQLPLD